MPAVALQAFYKQGDGVFIAIVFMSCLFLHAAASRRRGAFVAGRLVGPGVCVCVAALGLCSTARAPHLETATEECLRGPDLRVSAGVACRCSPSI